MRFRKIITLLLGTCLVITFILLGRHLLGRPKRNHYVTDIERSREADEIKKEIIGSSWSGLAIEDVKGDFSEYPEEIADLQRIVSRTYTTIPYNECDNWIKCKLTREEASLYILVGSASWKFIDTPEGESSAFHIDQNDESRRYYARLYAIHMATSAIDSPPNTEYLPSELAEKVSAYFQGINDKSNINAKRAAAYFDCLSRSSMLKGFLPNKKAYLFKASNDLFIKNIDTLTYDDYLVLLGINPVTNEYLYPLSRQSENERD